ncbi:MAG: GGDEF domain-containing protein, partial [Oscillospiraceae bacterium]|nr:GGDEF domain-containing protein [Oscillospiraceae bacterium]
YISEDGNEVYYYCKSNGISGWNVIVIFDGSEINGDVYSAFRQQFLILLCMCVLLIIYIINILHRESSPLHEIRDCTKEIASGNYNYRIKNIAKNELGAVAQNVNRIAEIMQAKTSVISSYNTTDILTGLKNRSAMYERLNDIIQTREDGRSRFALMFVDIDNFRWLNETLGHNYGDEVLSRFGTIIKEQLPNDMSVFRFSGDEFIIIKEFDTDYSEVYSAIENLHNRFNNPIEIMNDKIYIKFSIGVSIFPDDDVTPERLLRNAETALHRAKDSGKDRVAFYTNTNRDRSSFSKAEIARSLPDALQNGELFLHYQPIVSTATRDIHGFEVLLRWISPEFGVVPPADFINVAEESGDIVKIGTWIFESACRTLKQINETIDPNIIMSINVSPVQLKRDDYIGHIKQVIDITRVNPKNIQLEITESTLIDFTDSNSSLINEINKLGISLALDDFGTGYSSLNYLKNFPIKCLKIDKSFIDEINNNQRDYAITDSIIDLVHGLGIHTVAEGIETVGQYNFLAEMKCDYIQGFLMSKPLDERDAIEFLESYDALHKPDERQLRENEKQLADEREQQRLEKEKESGSSGVTEDFIISK